MGVDFWWNGDTSGWVVGVFLIVLPPGYEGEYHGHENVACDFQVLVGELIESFLPNNEVVHSDPIVSTYTKHDNGVSINDLIGIHKISSKTGCISIHKYTKLSISKI